MAIKFLETKDGKKIFDPKVALSHAYLLPWYTNKENVVIKGSKGAGKSYFVALWLVVHIMQQPHSSAVIIRKVFDTISGSCYQDIKNALYDLEVLDKWNCTVQPMQFTYKPTGQTIIFRGLDDTLKLASLRAPPNCYFCWVWFEEAFEITDFGAITKVQASIRAIPPETGLKKKFFFSFNPWHKFHWLKEQFFDQERDDTLALTTTYLDNPAFSEDDKRYYRNLEIYNPKAAEVIVHGEWGSSQGQIYENWTVEDFDPEEVASRTGVVKAIGLDFGYSVSYNALSVALVDVKNHEMWIIDEMYQKGMTNADIAKKVTEMGYAFDRIVADCAEPKSIYELKNGLIVNEGGDYRRYALPNIEPALKGKDSVINAIQRIQTYKIHVLSKCQYHIMEFSSYSWEIDKDGQFTGKPEKEHDHCLVRGTLISTNKGDIPIEEIQAGDKVLTHMGYQEVIAGGLTQKSQRIYRLELEDGRYIEGTYNHPVMTTEGYKYLGAISNSNEVYTCQTNLSMIKPELVPVRVQTVYATERYEDVYDLTVDIAHTFFANGILVHNCMDALHYGTDRFLRAGKGRVAVAKGREDVPSNRLIAAIDTSISSEYKCRRVFATHE